MASQTSSQNVLKFKGFKEELHALLDNVLEQAETLQNTAKDPVPLDREWILQKMRDQITTEKYMLEPRAMQVTQGLGNLFKLPPELRDTIYGHAIADGTTTILLASTQTHKEASKFLFSKGIYRLIIGFGDRITSPPISQEIAERVQNLNIRVNARGFMICGLEEYLPTIHMFDGTNIKRKSCIVTFEWDPFSLSFDATKVVQALRELQGFERVILEQDLDWHGEPWPDTLYWFQKDQIRSGINREFLFHKEILEPTLGEGDYGYDEEGLRLAFHPRK